MLGLGQCPGTRQGPSQAVTPQGRRQLWELSIRDKPFVKVLLTEASALLCSEIAGLAHGWLLGACRGGDCCQLGATGCEISQRAPCGDTASCSGSSVHAATGPGVLLKVPCIQRGSLSPLRRHHPFQERLSPCLLCCPQALS